MVLVNQRFSPSYEFFGVDLTVCRFSRQPYQLVLPLQQPQADLLLGVLHIALQRLMFALHFFQTQVAERCNDGGQKQQHRGHWGQHGKAVLLVGRLAAPPRAPPVDGGFGAISWRQGRRGRGTRLHPSSVEERSRENPQGIRRHRRAPSVSAWSYVQYFILWKYKSLFEMLGYCERIDL